LGEEPIAILKSYDGKKQELTIYKNIIYITVRRRKGTVESIVGLTFLIMLFMHGTVFLLVHNCTRIFFWLFWLSIMWSLVFPKYRIYLESKEIYRQFMYMDLPSLKSNLIGGVDKIFKSGEPVNKGRYYYKLWLSGDRYGKGIPLGSLRKAESSYDDELKTLVIDKKYPNA
jgi:hypothetical protein